MFTNRLRILGLLALLLLAQGCAQVQNFQTYQNQVLDGRHASLVNDYENRVGLFSDDTGEEYRHPKVILTVCRAYLELKRYSTFFSCISDVEKQTANDGFFTALQGAYTLNSDQARAYIAPLMAKAHLDLGDPVAALRQANIAIQAVESLKDMDKSWYDYNNFRMELLHEPLSIAVISAKLANQQQAMQSYLSDLVMLVDEVDDANSFLKGQVQDPNPRNAHLNLAKAYFALEQYEKALTELKKSGEVEFVGLISNIVLPSIVLTKLAFNDKDLLSQGDREFIAFPRSYMVARITYELGGIDEALEQYEALLNNPQLKNFGSLQWAILYDIARINLTKDNNAAARDYLIRAIDEIESHRENINTEAGKIGFVGDKQAVYFTLVNLLYEQQDFALAFEYVERAKARALVDMLADNNSFGDPRTNALLDELKSLERASLAVNFLDTPAADNRGIEIQSVSSAINQVSEELSSLTQVKPTRLSDIQYKLNEHESLLEFYGANETYFAFVLRKNRVDAVKLDVPALESTITLFRDSIESNTSDYHTHALAVYNQLIAPVSSLLQGETLTIVPHGNLHYIPFAALTDGNSFLIDRYDLRFLPSSSILDYLNKDTRSESDLLALGNPDLGDAQYDLPGAQTETLLIDQGWTDSKVLLRQFASEANFKKFAPSFKYLHLASHGEFNSQSPLQSRMLLAPGDGEDGNLTVSELYGLTLNAELVTLSACETALGEVNRGDDVVGLTRGFLYAGSKSIVASLWAVSDDATAHLMAGFYLNLKTMPKASALRQAILATKQQYPQPALWSAFQLTGAL